VESQNNGVLRFRDADSQEPTTVVVVKARSAFSFCSFSTLRYGVVLRSAPTCLAQQSGVMLDTVSSPGIETGDISHLGFSALIIGQRYCTTGIPTLKKLKTRISNKDERIFTLLFIDV